MTIATEANEETVVDTQVVEKSTEDILYGKDDQQVETEVEQEEVSEETKPESEESESDEGVQGGSLGKFEIDRGVQFRRDS